MRVPHHLRKTILAYSAALIGMPFAVFITSHFAAMRGIPWALCLLVIAFVADLDGVGPILVAGVTATAGIYRLILAPSQHQSFNLATVIQIAAFIVTAAFISFLVRQRKLAGVTLAASEEHYRCVTETAPDVIVTIDQDSRILSINPAAEAIFGYTPAELIGQKMGCLMPERFRAGHTAGIARHLSTGQRHIDWNGVQLPGIRKDGAEIPLEISFGAHSSRGETRFTGYMRDVSERQRTNEALLQNEKLAAVGRLATSIAHEINNPLEAVTNLLYLSRSATDFSVVQDYLATAEQELRRVSVIANQTLHFHKESMSPTQVDCNELIRGAAGIFQGRLRNAGIVLEGRYRASTTAYSMEGEIRQVLTNFLSNSIDAMPHGGRLITRTRDATDWQSGRKGVAITVADTGTGLSPETELRMFEAFFSTKGAGGAGLGLWVSSQLIVRNRGNLRTKSSQRAGRSGTVFVLFLPGRPPDPT